MSRMRLPGAAAKAAIRSYAFPMRPPESMRMPMSYRSGADSRNFIQTKVLISIVRFGHGRAALRLSVFPSGAIECSARRDTLSQLRGRSCSGHAARQRRVRVCEVGASAVRRGQEGLELPLRADSAPTSIAWERPLPMPFRTFSGRPEGALQRHCSMDTRCHAFGKPSSCAWISPKGAMGDTDRFDRVADRRSIHTEGAVVADGVCVRRGPPRTASDRRARSSRGRLRA